MKIPITTRTLQLIRVLELAVEGASEANKARALRSGGHKHPAKLLENEREWYAAVLEKAHPLAEQAIRLGCSEDRHEEIRLIVRALEIADETTGGASGDAPRGLAGSLCRARLALRGALRSEGEALTADRLLTAARRVCKVAEVAGAGSALVSEEDSDRALNLALDELEDVVEAIDRGEA